MLATAWLSGCAPAGEEPPPEPTWSSTDAVVFGDRVVCDDPVDTFDRLAPMAADLGIEHGYDGPPQQGLGHAGVVARDLDGDGDLDLSFGDRTGAIPIWANDGEGNFEPLAPLDTLGLIVMRHAAVDLTGDGLPEWVFTGMGHVTWRENLGDLTWGEARVLWDGPAGALSAAMSFGDADGDGDLDLALPGLRREGGPGRDRVLRNTDSGFEVVERWPESGPKPMSVVAQWTDRDGDGDQDLFVASHRNAQGGAPNSFFRNEGGGGWPELVEDADAIGMAQIYSPMGIDSADLNDDGTLDYCITDTGAIRCHLSTPEGWVEAGAQIGLEPPQEPGGSWSGWSIDLVDLDVDGWLDAAAVAAFADVQMLPWPDQTDGLWRGSSEGFELRGQEVGFDDVGGRYGLVAADLFGDGYPELITAGFDGVEVWDNPCGAGAWLDLKLLGPADNVDAFGARIEASAGDVRILRELQNSRGPNQGPASVHLGFGGVDVVDEIRITWPDGHVSELRQMPTDRRLTVLHPSAPEVAISRF